MAVQEKFGMRVYLSPGDIRKLTMTPRPDTVEDLIGWLKGNLQLTNNFSLQYDDPDWGLCNLYDLGELPEKPTIHVIPILELVPIPSATAVPVLDDPTSAAPDIPTTAEGNSSDTGSQADTDILSDTSLRSSPWPEVFQIPHFGLDVEYRLNEGNLKYMQDQTYLTMNKELKHKILHTLAQTIYEFDPYPGKKDREVVAKALLDKHPCLGKSSWMSWMKSLDFKMGNYRGDMKRMGRLEVCVNGGKRGRGGGDEREPPNKGIKKARKGEINFLPHYDEMHDSKMEEARQALSNEMLKKTPNGSLIKKQMDNTFAFRRKEIVSEKPDVSEMLERWPALFTESQVSFEFTNRPCAFLHGAFMHGTNYISVIFFPFANLLSDVNIVGSYFHPWAMFYVSDLVRVPQGGRDKSQRPLLWIAGPAVLETDRPLQDEERCHWKTSV